jgi:NADPH2:quinone reductase
MMRAWQCQRLSGIDGLAAVAMPVAAPGPGEAVLQIAATALNQPDLLMLSGRYQYRPDPPFVPGMEAVGRILAVGEGLSADLIGQRMIAGTRSGLLAEAATLPVMALRPAPEALDDREAAGFTTGALTAWMALVARGRLQPGDHLLVLGAGGGMGLAAVALGAALGARVTALASSPAKCAAARQAGADAARVIDRAAPDLAVLGRQCDCVFDPVGGPLVAPALSALRRGGRYLVIGFVAGPPVAVATDRIAEREIAILGVRAGEAGRRDPALGRRALAAIDSLAAQGHLRPAIGLEVPFAEAPDAFRALEGGSLVGKAVVRMAPH